MQQGTLKLGAVSSRQFDPVPTATEGASRYTGGRHSIAGLEHTQANPERGFRVAQAMRAAETAPETPKIRGSFEAMRQEVNRQHAFMTAPKESGGMGLQHEVTDHDPYPDATHMAKDVAGGRIKTLSTAATGGHEYFSDEENDKFRAVHDVFGHAATGRGFSRHGEEAAYLSHRQMFPRKAQAALASETRGQNSFFNYGPTTAEPEKRFPNQANKLMGLPAFAQRK
jgi:hypothetical protein